MTEKTGNSFESNLLNNLLDTWIVPDIQRRQESGDLEKPTQLRMAQIIFFANAQKPIVRINDEVRGRASFKLKEGLSQPVAAGDPIYWEQIEELESFQLDPEERDNGHATIFSFKKKWLITFDFIYNKNRSAQHLDAAREYLDAARSAWKASFRRPFIDNLAAASELSAKAYLLGRPDKSVMTGKSHGTIHRKINAERRIGNVESDHIDSFNYLQKERFSARYLDKEVELDEVLAQKLLSDIEGFISEIEERLRIAL